MDADSSIFRTKAEPEALAEEVLPKGKEPDRTQIDDKIDVPFLDYQQEKGKPFLVDFYDLGMHWDDPKGGFAEEVEIIQKFLERKIKNGDIANSQQAIKSELSQIEEINNLKNEFRKIVKMGTMAAYTKFLLETEGIKVKAKRYGYQ